MSTVKNICDSIRYGALTNAEINEVTEALRFARAQLTHENRRQLQVGNKVKFTSNRNGITYTGTVRKVKIKYIEVAVGNNAVYNVPANMLEAA